MSSRPFLLLVSRRHTHLIVPPPSCSCSGINWLRVIYWWIQYSVGMHPRKMQNFLVDNIVTLNALYQGMFDTVSRIS